MSHHVEARLSKWEISDASTDDDGDDDEDGEEEEGAGEEEGVVEVVAVLLYLGLDSMNPARFNGRTAIEADPRPGLMDRHEACTNMAIMKTDASRAQCCYLSIIMSGKSIPTEKAQLGDSSQVAG